MVMSTSNQLPVIDISSTSPETAKALVKAISDYGFVYIKSNAIPAKSVAHMFDLSREFFTQTSPAEKVKFAVSSKDSGKNGGYFGMHVEKLDPETQKRGDFKEAFNFNEFPLASSNGSLQTDTDSQALPPVFEFSRSDIVNFSDSCHQVCMRILSLFGQGLEIDEAKGGGAWFEQRHDRSKGKSGSVFRFLYYPAINHSVDSSSNDSKSGNEEEEEDNTDIRCGAHSDYGSITLLFRRDLPGQTGLEIQTDGGSWATVPVDPDGQGNKGEMPPILVNVGDLLSFWTNGLLKSTVHRVVFPREVENADRYSIAYFCHPLDEARLESVPSRLLEGLQDGKGRREVITAKEHLERRLNATYS